MLRCGRGVRAARARPAHPLACTFLCSCSRARLAAPPRRLARPAALRHACDLGCARCGVARAAAHIQPQQPCILLRVSARIGLTAPLLTTQSPLAPHDERAEVRPCDLRAHLGCIAATDVTLHSPHPQANFRWNTDRPHEATICFASGGRFVFANQHSLCFRKLAGTFRVEHACSD